MTYPRHSLISLKETPYYHVVARCVRRAWLWGYDSYAGKDYSHRKDWVLERLKGLSEVFALDICAYAVMNPKSSRSFMNACPWSSERK